MAESKVKGVKYIGRLGVSYFGHASNFMGMAMDAAGFMAGGLPPLLIVF